MQVHPESDFDELLTERAIYPVFQPIVSLADRRVVAFEALARGPDGSPYYSPGALFREAHRRGVAAQLDWICATRAFESALGAGIGRVPLFVNADPATFGTPCPVDLLPIYREALDELEIVLEITERRGGHPEAILGLVASFRQTGGRIAIDDVGVDPMSLQALSILAPDVIKLDRTVTQQRGTSWARTWVVNAVQVEAQVTGAAVLCEGIETAEDLQTARGLGATLGQGWLFGRPGPLPTTIDLSTTAVPRVAPYPKFASSPFEVLHNRVTTHRMNELTMSNISAVLEDMAQHTAAAHLLFVLLPSGMRLSDETRFIYTHIAERGVDVLLLCANPPPFPGGLVKTLALAETDRLLHEHAIILVGNYITAALIARRSDVPDSISVETLYDAALTYDRRVVIEALHTLLRRLPAI